MRFWIIILYFECCFLFLNIFADTSHDLIVHSGNDHRTYIILDFLDGMSVNFIKPENQKLDIKILKPIQNECHSSFKFFDSNREISGQGIIKNTSLTLKCRGNVFDQEISSTEFHRINFTSCTDISDKLNFTFTFRKKCGLILSIIQTITVSIHVPPTSLLPLPYKIVLEDNVYFILSNITTKWMQNLQRNENNQWKYTVLKNVNSSMFVLDEKYPRNVVIFDAGKNESCITVFKLTFHVPSKCEVKFSYKNQQLTLEAGGYEEVLQGRRFKLYFHEGKLIGIQMNPFQIIELYVCQIETTSAHAWLIHDVEVATCENTSFIFDSNVQIAVTNSTKSSSKTFNTYESSKHFEKTTTATKKTDNASMTWLWIILGITFILILIGFSLIVFYKYCCSREKSSTDEFARQYERHKLKIKAKRRQKKQFSIGEPGEQ
uniref:Uncharacterized protein n=1 Tax=Panagrolaimus superbus TaxID=310955 RepID=A0A914Y4Y2_9BILA